MKVTVVWANASCTNVNIWAELSLVILSKSIKTNKLLIISSIPNFTATVTATDR